MTDAKGTPIGVIGLGAMGAGMAGCLVRAGFEVRGYDVRAEAGEALAAIGGTAAASPAEQGEELADVLEVLKAIASELGQPWDEIETTAAEKRAERGGFEAGIWLEL